MCPVAYVVHDFIAQLLFIVCVCTVVVEFLPDGLSYYPILYFNDYWNLNQDYMPVNSSTKSASCPYLVFGLN